MPAGDAVPDAGELYDEAYYTGAPRRNEEQWERMLIDAATRRAAHAKAFNPPGRRFLEVGCGTGIMLTGAAAHGFDVHGVEVSASGAAYAKQRFGVPVTVGTLESARFADGSFDVVWMQYVLEHVPDPVGLLREIRRVLAPGGILFVAVPHARGLIYRTYNMVHFVRGKLGTTKYAAALQPPGHILGFTTSSLRTALDRAELTTMKTFLSGKGDPIYYPVLTWKGAGRWPAAIKIVERLGRATGTGSLLAGWARKPTQ